MKEITLDARLLRIASFVNSGAVVADVGTDHAYLPIYLIQNGIARRAVASDINEGPLASARANAQKYAVAEKMSFYLADGLCALPLEREGVDTVVIAGMGGEMCASILEASDFARSGALLILQPMSSVYELRRYLSGGYEIIDEDFVRDGHHFYQIIVCRYDGVRRDYTNAQLYVGHMNIKKGALPLILHTAKIFERQKTGKELGGLDTEYEARLISELRGLLPEGYTYED